MEYFAGLDVSLEETTICVVDEAGRIVREARAISEPEARVRLRRLALLTPSCGGLAPTAKRSE